MKTLFSMLFGAWAGQLMRAVTPLYALSTTTPDGPTPPGPTSPAGVPDQFANSAVVWTKDVFSSWFSEGSLVARCDKRIESQFMGNGDQIGITLQDRKILSTGITFTDQPRQVRNLTVDIGPVRGIHDKIDGSTGPLYLQPEVERAGRKRDAHRFVVGIEQDIANEMAIGYARGAMVFHSTGSVYAQASVDRLGAAGEQVSNWPNISLPSTLQADFAERAITGRTLCASYDPMTAAALAQSPAANAFFSTPAGQRGWTGGTLVEGSQFGGFKTMRSSNQGTVSFVNTESAMTVSAAPVEGSTSATLNIANGQRLRRGQKIAFEDCFSINEETGEPTSRLAQFTVTADTGTSGTTKAVSFYPAYDSAPRTATDRWRYVSARPAGNDKVYLFEADTSVAALRTAYGGKQAARSLLFADMSTIFVMVPITLPKRDREVAKQVTSREAGISFNYVEYFVGDSYQYRTRLDGRWGQKVAEAEAGWVVTGLGRS